MTRIERYRRVPELGPKLLFLTGGTAMRPLSRVLKRYTHNTIHLITPFDSGGSSAKLRDAFDMPSVGDLRNRILALADETARGDPEVYELFARRLDAAADNSALARELDALIDGSHPLIQAIVEPTQRLLRRHFAWFRDRMPSGFDLRGASLGNLVMAGGFLERDRDIDAVIRLLARLVRARGKVCPIADAPLHLVADLADGSQVFGQHRITGKDHPPIPARIDALRLVDGRGAPAAFEVSDSIRGLIAQADLVCFPVGSFWTSVVANLLPSGVGRAITRSDAPKVFIPNAGEDPEMVGMRIHDCVEVLHRTVSADGVDLPMDRVVNFVLVDSEGADYGDRLDVARLRDLGVQILDLPLASRPRPGLLDAERLAAMLLSLA